MSYYPIPRRDLIRLIGLNWLKKANVLKRENCKHGGLLHSKPIWSKIKQVYTDLQGKKCVFCDLRLLTRGSANADLEHFRPKGAIVSWPIDAITTYGFQTGDAQATGYYWLAYDPFNYASSCKHCNSALKRCRFPILGPRGIPHNPIALLNASEQPLLLFPFGPLADNPAKFFSFNGVIAMVHPDISASDARRARVSIDFFDLNHIDILKIRMEIVITIFERCSEQLTLASPAATERANMTVRIKRHYKAEQSYFANWYFDRIKNGTPDDQADAAKTYNEAVKFMESIGI